MSKLSSLTGEIIGSSRYFDQFSADIWALENLNEYKIFTRNGVSFSNLTSVEIKSGFYKDGDHEIYIESNLIFKAADKIAIIGPSGAGKSTFLGLLYGISPTARQRVLWNRIPLEDVSSFCQLKLSTYSPQNSSIITGELEENIFHSDQNQKHLIDDLLTSLKISHLEERNTIISENTVSGGEAKRISLIRSLLNRSAQIVILDEPTAGLNPDISNTVWEVVKTYSKKSLLFCATHDYSNLDYFNRVIMISDGFIREITE